MKLSRTAEEIDYNSAIRSGDVHVVAFAEEGLSFFKAYAEFALGIPGEVAIGFCQQINRADETGTLWPKGNLTAMLKRFFREPRFDVGGFRRCLRDAFVANRDFCRSKHMVFQFFCVDQHLNELFQEVENMAKQEFGDSGIESVTVHMNSD